MVAMADIILAGILGIAFSILQLLLLRRVLRVQSGGLRIVLMLLKVPLWALAFIGIALYWTIGALLAFGLAAGATYLTTVIVVYIRSHPSHRKGE